MIHIFGKPLGSLTIKFVTLRDGTSKNVDHFKAGLNKSLKDIILHLHFIFVSPFLGQESVYSFFFFNLFI